MTIAKVNQLSRSYPQREEQLGQKNMFDLSHDVKTTFTMGKLVPFLVLETIPDDEWFIRGEFMMRFAPLYLPIMHRVNMSADYFFIPFRIMWTDVDSSVNEKGWPGFIFDILNQEDVFPPTYDVIPYDGNLLGTVAMELPQYMGFPTQLVSGTVMAQMVVAFYLSSYYMVWDQYYRNDQIQDEVWKPLHAGDNDLIIPYGAGSALACMYRNWNRDIFTSATPTPQSGVAVMIPLVDTDNFKGPFEFLNRNTGGKITPGGDGTYVELQNTEGGDMQLSSNDTPMVLDIQSTAATIAQLRYNLMLQEYLERHLRAGDRYSDQMMSFFRTDPFKGVIQVPQFLGSKRGKVVISEVMSTTETATLKVGSYAGQAMSLESTSDTISYHCLEHGVILGIISVYPDSSYFQGIEKMWTRFQPSEYWWEQFALVGDEEILAKEVNADLRTIPVAGWNDSVWGYNRRGYSYTHKNDIVSGQMRTQFISFHLGRLFDFEDPDNIVLNSEFIQCRPDVTRVFQVAEGEDEIYAHIYNDIKALRRIPKYGIPAI